MKEIEFLEKEEKRLKDCLKMHENSAKLLKEDISAIQQIKERLQGQPDCEAAPSGSQV